MKACGKTAFDYRGDGFPVTVMASAADTSVQRVRDSRTFSYSGFFVLLREAFSVVISYRSMFSNSSFCGSQSIEKENVFLLLIYLK